MEQGAAKVGGTMQVCFHKLANEEGYTDCIYLKIQLLTQEIEKPGAANFFGITKDNKFITPDSDHLYYQV